MQFLSRPTDAADSGSHFGKQFQQISPCFGSFPLFAGELVQITANEAVYRGVLLHRDPSNFLQNRVLNREGDVSRHPSTVTVFLCRYKPRLLEEGHKTKRGEAIA
ncbi:MAG: hypothetical protein DLM52_09930 [Chthoniobacterales bacterium]|nr:MAG: hypothetical protein DLM52_09930 [Chthoniobacterales bacterium]